MAVAAFADPKIEFLRKHVSLEARSVLDVACGNGVFTIRLARIAGSVVALDSSSHMLALNPHPTRVQSSAAALPFEDRSFDVVFEANLLHHVDDPQEVVSELCRCSARHLMLIEPNRWNPLMLGFGLLVGAERRLLRSSRRIMVRLVEKAGFRVKAISTTGMISQNNTPGFLIPWLKRFDREMILGEYIVLCAERP
jgi:SAM-dependent methyltransferase